MSLRAGRRILLLYFIVIPFYIDSRRDIGLEEDAVIINEILLRAASDPEFRNQLESISARNRMAL